MAKSKEPTPDNAQPEPSPVARTKKRCPYCAATIFQGPFSRGEIIDGTLNVRETLWQCVGCNAVLATEQLQDH